MIYNSSKGDNKANSTRPFIYLDFNNLTNFCFAYPWSVSIDPNVCLVNIASGTDLNRFLFGGVNIDGKEVLKPTYSQIQADNKYDPGADILSKKISETSNGFYKENNNAYLMNVLLNIEYIVGKMDSLAGTAPDKSVKLDKFLTEILSDINNSLGGVNEFRVAFNDDSYCIQFLDEQRLVDPEPAVIDVIGLSSIVQNYSFQSKISPKLASMIVIGAQAGNISKKQAGIDASAVGKWNEFVEDRIMPARVDSIESQEGSNNATNAAPAAPTEGGQAESPDDQLSRHIKGVYQNFKYSESDIEGARKLLNEKLLAIKANLNDTTAVSLIPLEMSITMDGISGILVRQAFVIPPERLPLSYQEKIGGKGTTKLGFIVNKVENSVENNRWLTTISGQSLNLSKAVKASVVKIDPLPQRPSPAPATATGGTTPRQTTDPTVQANEAANTDRIMPTRVDSTDSQEGSNNATNAAPAAPTEGGQAESPDDQLSRHIKGVYQNFKYSESDIEGARKLLNEKLLAIKANLNDTTAVSLIPLEMSITMDGISGILVNQTFVIPPERLPLSYQEKIGGGGTTKLGFIVRRVENSVDNNRWLTTISGQSINLSKAVKASVVKIDPLPQRPAPAPAAATGGTTPRQTTDPTVQANEAANTDRIQVPNSGKNTTTNTYTFLPKTTNKAVDVFIFYPGINVGGKVGRDYMPQKVTAAAPDWFDKYVLVFPTTWTTSYSSVKREYEELLTKAGLTVKSLNIGIYSGSGNNTASVLSALQSSGRELKNFIMMDPVPSGNLVKAVNAIKNRGGTAQYLYYNTTVWGGAAYYGGVDSKGQLYGPIKNLVDAGTGKVAITKTTIGHYDIPTSILKAYKSQIEQYLG